VLQQSGVPLVFDEEDQCYRIPGTYFLPPTNFTPDEALSLIVLCHQLGNSRALPFLEPAHRAALKLESSLPAHLREQLQRVAGAVEIKPAPSNPLAGRSSIYEQLLQALAERRPVRIEYQSVSERELIRTKLSPYRLLFSRRSWYVIGRSSLHRSVRTFNLGRIAQIELLDEHYKIPRGFSLQRYLRNAWHLIPEPGPDRKVRIRFSPLVARNVAEVAWHKTQKLHFNDDGSLDFEVTVSGLNEISWWIAGYADQAEVLEPPELREMMAQRAARILEIYQASAARPKRTGGPRRS